ncbi:zinc finger protein 862-like [Antedon mediterranea]|uniref:zinc finger protein 862-like n=1 Tax=Antedon mediterranea TaxID=105859 RepID=UPI003AF78AE9
MAKGETEEREKIQKLMDICYMMALEEIPFSKFPRIAQLEIRHKVPLGQTYLTEPKCREFSEIIGEVIENETLNKIKEAKYISILSDGSTDVSNLEKELVYVTFATNAEVSTKLLSIRNIKYAHAEGLTELLLDVMKCAGIDPKKQLVGYCADGASVNMGRVNGVAARLKRDVPVPWMVVIHCASHRLELAIKDAFKGVSGIDMVIDMLQSIYYLYEKSSKRLRELRVIGEVMEEAVLKPCKANGTRWIQHKARACSALIQNYQAIVAHLEAQGADNSDVPAAEKTRLKGYLKILKSLKFVFHLLYMNIVLVPLSHVCRNFQKGSIDLLQATSCLEQLSTTLNHIVNDSTENIATMGPLGDLIVRADADPGNATYKLVRLSNGSPAVVTAFKNQMVVIAEKIMECMSIRFRDIEHDNKIKCLKLLDCTLWPKDKDQLSSYGIDILDTFIDEFADLLSANQVNTDNLQIEWANFKHFWLENLAHLPRSDLWNTVTKHYADIYPNLIHVINVLIVFPVSNAVVERGFSAMGRVKTDHRNRLGEKTLEQLMRINLEGDKLEHFNPTLATDRFFSSVRYPNPQPYGKRTMDDPEGDDIVTAKHAK